MWWYWQRVVLKDVDCGGGGVVGVDYGDGGGVWYCGWKENVRTESSLIILFNSEEKESAILNLRNIGITE